MPTGDLTVGQAVPKRRTSARPPDWLPDAVARHSGVPDMLPAGASGKAGVLDLGFEAIGGRTELIRHFQKAPLHIARPSTSGSWSTPIRTRPSSSARH